VLYAFGHAAVGWLPRIAFCWIIWIEIGIASGRRAKLCCAFVTGRFP
jgi:hypothetical protein